MEAKNEAGLPGGATSAIRAGSLAVGGQVTARVLTTIGLLVFARYLTPEELGYVAMAGFAVLLIATLTNLGLPAAVQVLPGTERVARTALTVGLGVGAVSAAVLVIGASAFGRALGASEAASLIAALAPTAILAQYVNVRRAMLERELRFGITTTVTVVSVLVGTTVGVVSAVGGSGAWAFVYQQLTIDAVACLFMIVIPIGSRLPGWAREEAGWLWGYGRELLAGGIIAFFYNNLDDMAVGRWIGAGALGAYKLAYDLSNALTYLLTRPVNRALLPIWARLSEERERWGAAYVRVVRLLALAGGLGIMALALHVPALLDAVYGDRWDGIVGIVRILSVYGLVRIVGATTGPIFVAAHRPELIRQVAQWQLIAMLPLLGFALSTRDLEVVAVAVTVPLIVAAAISLVIAARLAGAEPKRVLSAVGVGWTIAALANAAAVPVVISIGGLAGVLCGALMTLVVATVLARRVVADDVSSILEAVRPATGGEVVALAE